MKRIFLVGIIAASLLGCTEDYSSSNDVDKELQITLSLGGISTRAIDESIIGADGKGYLLPFTKVKTLKVELYKSSAEGERPIYTHTANDTELSVIKETPSGENAKLIIPKIPATTQYVKVIINEFSTADPDINGLQVTSRDASSLMTREDIPYEGYSDAVIIPEESSPDYTKVRALVEVAPVLSRFEIKPGNIVLLNPVDEGYVFDWSNGTSGKGKIKGFTSAEITALESNAVENFKNKYGVAPSGTAVYSYRVRLIQTSFPDYFNFDINHSQTGTQGVEYRRVTFYFNYFKQNLSSSTLVKHVNDNVSDWLTKGNYNLNGTYSNMCDKRSYNEQFVNAFHLFPQLVASSAGLQEVKEGMPHLIMGFYNNQYDNESASFDDSLRPDRWLTIRAFSKKTVEGELIRSFEPGYCYILSLDDVILTPWTLGLEVRITDSDKTTVSDPVIKDFDQTSHVPEPENVDFSIKLEVSKWRDKDMEIEL